MNIKYTTLYLWKQTGVSAVSKKQSCQRFVTLKGQLGLGQKKLYRTSYQSCWHREGAVRGPLGYCRNRGPRVLNFGPPSPQDLAQDQGCCLGAPGQAS